MIVTFTPNPALDKTAVVAGFRLGGIARTADVRMLAGGKGFNVARSLRVLGGDPLVVAPLAGHTGRLIADLARAEKLRCHAWWIEGETRTCLSVVDTDDGVVSEVYERGPEVSSAAWEGTVALLRQHLRAGDTLAISGSVPPGVPADALHVITRWAGEAGVLLMLDTYGAQLEHALAARPALAKCNAAEASDLVGFAVDGLEDGLRAAAALRARGAQAVAITLGAAGAVGVDRHGTAWGWRAPRVASVSAVGSGDACFAGIVLGLAAGQSLAEAARSGVAAGAANTLQTGAGIFRRSDVDILIDEVEPWEGNRV